MSMIAGTEKTLTGPSVRCPKKGVIRRSPFPYPTAGEKMKIQPYTSATGGMTRGSSGMLEAIDCHRPEIRATAAASATASTAPMTVDPAASPTVVTSVWPRFGTASARVSAPGSRTRAK